MGETPSQNEVFIEFLEDPFTGLTLLGIGSRWRAESTESCRARVLIDGVPRAEFEVTQSPHDGQSEYHFAGHFPFESGTLVTVWLGETLIAERDCSLIPHRQPAVIPPPVYGWRRIARPVFQLLRQTVRCGFLRSSGRARIRDAIVRIKQAIQHRSLRQRYPHRSPHAGYVAHTSLTPTMRTAMERQSKAFRYRPKISILMPIYNVDPKWLDAAIQSVRSQIYDNWELCMADDASDKPSLVRYLNQLPDDPRFQLVRRPKNGHICAATNSAAMHATGTFIALLDNDDALSPDALFEIVKLLQDHPEADVIYSDEDKIDEREQRYDPQFKPDWSREMLLAYNYFNHFTCIRRSLFEKVGRFRLGYEGSQDHDLLLRVVGETDGVFHIPKILYHWRALPSSSAAAATVKEYIHTSGRKALADYLYRERIDAVPYQPDFARRLGLPINLLEWPDEGGTVAIVVLSDGDPAKMKRCLDAIRTKTTYRNFRIVAVLNGPDLAVRTYLETVAKSDARIEILTQIGDIAERYNAIVERLSDDWVLFLDPTLEVIEPRWLSRLVGYCTMPNVAVTSASIQSHDGKRLHGGVVLGMRDGIAPANAFHGLALDAVSYYFQAEIVRPVAAVTGRCLLTSRKQFDLLNGFDVEKFGQTMFDVDYCQRLLAQGLRSLYVGSAELRDPDIMHTTRDDDRCDDPEELRRFGRADDPFYNPNLSEGRAFETACDGRSSIEVSPINALIVSHNLNNPEGAPRYLFEIAAGLKQRGKIIPSVWSPVGGKGEEAYRGIDVPVYVGDLAQATRFVDLQWTPVEYEAVQRDAMRFLREQKPHVVIANTLLTFPIIEAAAKLGIPSVWIIHESYSAKQRSLLMSPFARERCESAFALASRVVPASHDTADLFRDLNVRGNFVVLHNGLESRPFDEYIARVPKEAAAANLPGGPNRKRIIAVGTVCERKGQHTLVEAAALLRQRRESFACYLVGLREHLPYASFVRHLVKQYDLEDTVFLIPETDNVRAFYRAADVFVCTSHMETFSRAILEAEAFGLPIVSTACCGIREQVFWNQNALKFDMNDAGQLAAHLAKLLDDEPLRASMARKSRATFDNHLSYDEMLDRYERVVLSAAMHGVRNIELQPASLPTTVRKAA